MAVIVVLLGFLIPYPAYLTCTRRWLLSATMALGFGLAYSGFNNNQPSRTTFFARGGSSRGRRLTRHRRICCAGCLSRSTDNYSCLINLA